MEVKRKKAIITILAVLIVGLFIYLSQKEDAQESLIEKQKRELDALRGQAEPLTEEEIQKQKEELEELRKNAEPLTEEEINKQKEELDKLRSQ